MLVQDIKETEGFVELPSEEKPSKWKKILTISIAAFLILLIVSYVWISYGIDDIIASLIESKTLEENKVQINGSSNLIFKEDSFNFLLEQYLSNQDKEFKACLLGEIKKRNYEVTQVVIPEMIQQEFTKVVSKNCPEGTIADLHSQPYRKCIESEQDLKTKGIIKQTDPERLMVIMCEKYRFNFY